MPCIGFATNQPTWSSAYNIFTPHNTSIKGKRVSLDFNMKNYIRIEMKIISSQCIEGKDASGLTQQCQRISYKRQDISGLCTWINFQESNSEKDHFVPNGDEREAKEEAKGATELRHRKMKRYCCVNYNYWSWSIAINVVLSSLLFRDYVQSILTREERG